MQPAMPDVPKHFSAAARANAVDIAAALVIYIGVSLAAGRVFRFAFDDELLVGRIAEHAHGVVAFAAYLLDGGDVHPPLAFTLFYVLMRAGFADWGLRLVSLALTALSIGLFHLLALAILRQRQRAPAVAAVRLVAVLLFGLSPMAVSQGDAIRWYPLFAALIAIFAVLTLAGRGAVARLTGAAALGLAASTNFLAIFPAAAFALYRYGLQRRFAWHADLPYWLVVAAFGLPGLVTFGSIATAAATPHAISHGMFDAGPLTAAAITILGLAGGDAVGLGNAWIVMPLVVIAPIAVLAAVNLRQADDPMHFLLLLLAAIPVMVVAGFAEPRAFLYAMPVFAVAILLMLSDGLARGRAAALLIAMLVVAPLVGAIANIQGSPHPFKRNAVVPYDQVLGAIDANADGSTLIVSTDPVLAWMLTHERARPERCASYFFEARGCLGDTAGYQTVIVVGGHSSRSGNVASMRRFAEGLETLLGERQKVATMPIGYDADAALKSRLTGTSLSAAILTFDVYR